MKKNKIDEQVPLEEKRETFRAEIVRRKAEGKIFGPKHIRPNEAGLPKVIQLALVLSVVVFAGVLFYRSAHEKHSNAEQEFFATARSEIENLRSELLSLEEDNRQWQARMISASQELNSISNRNNYDEMARSGSLGVTESLILARKMFDDPAYESKNATLERSARTNLDSAVAKLERTESRISELKKQLGSLEKKHRGQVLQ